jgi:hypothetical protein
MHHVPAMTLEEKIRYGSIALAGAAAVGTAFGIHLSPLAEIAGGAGTGF